MHLLVVHGWMHSADRYKDLKRDLESFGICKVELYEFPGFGNEPTRYKDRILEHYVKDMQQYLKEQSFDGILAHSMGGNVVLKAVAEANRGEKLMLLSPVYGGIRFLKPAVFFGPLLFWGIRLLQIPCAGMGLLIRVLSLLTVNQWSAMDRQLVEDVRRADASTGVKILAELASDRWRVKETYRNERVMVVLGERDRVISRKHIKQLSTDLGGCPVKILERTGHTAVLEDYDRLLELVGNWIVG
ncbi:MAG: alpha/beta hydrolase [Lachnospiraceae bacterium]|jgi:pimeloyl-ACP methyl ester carboxylesterase|nr:alpha/beta hydrolase [Lachnospiraceae bacterium]